MRHGLRATGRKAAAGVLKRTPRGTLEISLERFSLEIVDDHGDPTVF
jgi:hypothetical protein